MIECEYGWGARRGVSFQFPALDKEDMFFDYHPVSPIFMRSRLDVPIRIRVRSLTSWIVFHHTELIGDFYSGGGVEEPGERR